MKEAIRVEHLYFSYEKGVETLKDISFNVNKGEYVALIGHNGSGKSTLSKLLCYLLPADKGQIFVDGIEVKEENESLLRKKIGIVFQNPDNQFIGSTVEDDIAFGLENRNIPREEMVRLVHEFASKVGMIKYLNKSPDELSGGQKQRVAIAGILALGLKIIIFDEATSMLDPEGVEDIKKLIMEMKKEDPELTFISISHDIEEAYISDRVIILNKGEIFLDGKPNEVFQKEDLLKSIGLDIPFIMKVKSALKDKNVQIPDEINNIEELSDYLCK